MKNHFFRSLLMALLLAFHLPLLAEDTDLFVGGTPSSRDLPNVLIVLDNTANWTPAFTAEIAALRTVVDRLPVDTFRIGFMMFTESGGGNTGKDGGYVRSAMRPLNTEYRDKLKAMLASLDVGDDKSNGGKVANTMVDVFRYFTGGAPWSGNNKNKTDYTGNTFGTSASKEIYKLTGNALTEKAGTAYNPALPTGSCGKAFVIYISNGPAQDNKDDTKAAADELVLAAGGGDVGKAALTPIALSPSGSQDNVADEWVRFMHKHTLGLVTYTIEVNKKTENAGLGWTALLNSMATQSKGEYFDAGTITDNATQEEKERLATTILKAMENIFSKIQSDNSVFASVSLPVSVNTQGTYRNQVYIGMFRPAESAFPRWNGNLKQYRLAHVDGQLRLVDRQEPTQDNPKYTPAINSGKGFIDECAQSYWSPAGLDEYWAFNPTANCLKVSGNSTIAAYAKSNTPDGNIVDKGAQAYVLRNTINTPDTTRPLKTCLPGTTCTSLVNFSTANVTEAMLTPDGATTISTAERDALVNWARGWDVNNENNTDGINDTAPPAGTYRTTSTAPRPSVHGDIVHSRPVAINFGTDDNPKVVVFYGGNDGILRAVNGNRDGNSNSINGVAPGAELWSFMAPEFYKKIKRVRDNEIKIAFPNNLITSHTPLPKPYGLDGTITAYRDASRTWIYATMRRGGRVVYAFNVNPANPTEITPLWKIGCTDSGCTADATLADGDFRDIGQTWSPPKAFMASGYTTTDGVKKPLLIMGGGYDTCEDADVNTCYATGHTIRGNKVYILDAESGRVQKEFETERSVVADIFIVPDSYGNIKHAYAADLGGNIYRINIGAETVSGWTMTRIASLGCDNPTQRCASNRKFMFAPDVVEDEGLYSLMIGSGDREKPIVYYTQTATVANRFYMFKDRPSDAEWYTNEEAQCGGLRLVCNASLYAIGVSDATPSRTALAEKKGWYLSLRPSEQVVTSAITIFNVLNFSTHMPTVASIGSCTSDLGKASVYNIDYQTAASANGTGLRYQTISGGGLPPSPVAGKVMLDNGSIVPFCIGCKPASALEGGDPPTPPSAVQPKARVYWYVEK